MRKHLRYLSYLLRHKWYVFVECCRVGLFWRGLTHDLSKFRPSEWFPYVEFFYGGPHRSWADVTGWERRHFFEAARRDCKEEVDLRFDTAWLRHIHRNSHHPQHWVLREDSGTVKCLPMPVTDIFEMLCDWRGAGMAQHNPDDTRTWYLKNRANMHFHPETREHVERLLGVPVSQRY